jgi:hypothetical protein
MWNPFRNKIEVFVRHCHFSNISGHKKRIQGISREMCFENFLQTSHKQPVNITFFLDAFYPMEEVHFVKKQKQHPVIEISEGTESGSFLKLLDYVTSLNLDPETIVYFLEDDYMHKIGWVEILQEGFTLPVDYVTLFDHRDKYFHPLHQDLYSKIYHTGSCHWRTTPSTTNTFAMRYKTLLRDLEIHKEFSMNTKISRDHEKFCALAEQGALLISSIPGWSTHNESEFASPCTDWKILCNK